MKRKKVFQILSHLLQGSFISLKRLTHHHSKVHTYPGASCSWSSCEPPLHHPKPSSCTHRIPWNKRKHPRVLLFTLTVCLQDTVHKFICNRQVERMKSVNSKSVVYSQWCSPLSACWPVRRAIPGFGNAAGKGKTISN